MKSDFCKIIIEKPDKLVIFLNYFLTTCKTFLFISLILMQASMHYLSITVIVPTQGNCLFTVSGLILLTNLNLEGKFSGMSFGTITTKAMVKQGRQMWVARNCFLLWFHSGRTLMDRTSGSW